LIGIDRNAVIRFEDRASRSPFIEKIWRCRSERGGRFVSIAAANFEMALTRLAGRTSLTLRGPETKATVVDCPPNGEWLAIRFTPGTFLPAVPPGALRDHMDITLPEASSRSFWLNGSVWDYPDFENAEVFVHRLVQKGLLVRDAMIPDILQRNPESLSLRTAQRHFLRATGLSYATYRQIGRVRYATSLLREGVPILDAVHSSRYFDQAHLTRSFRRFIGETPSSIRAGEHQLSFLYKTEMPR
jgi:hypothetical protein